MIDNAVIIKELRSRMRGGRAFLTITLYISVLSFFAMAMYSTATQTMNMDSSSFYIGITIFMTISFLQLTKVSFLTPSFTVGAITKEKEQKTFELLITTKMSPLSVVIGKLISTTAYMLLLILASLPITGMVFLFGGVSVLDFALAYLITIITTIFFGSIGLFFSALTSRTQFSTVLTYATVLFFILGTVIISIFIGIALLGGPDPNKDLAEVLLRTVLVLNPFYALGSIFSGIVPGPFSVSMIVENSMDPASSPLMPDWSYTLIIYSALTIILLLASSELIKPVNRWKLKSLPLIGKRFGRQNPSRKPEEVKD